MGVHTPDGVYVYIAPHHIPPSFTGIVNLLDLTVP